MLFSGEAAQPEQARRSPQRQHRECTGSRNLRPKIDFVQPVRVVYACACQEELSEGRGLRDSEELHVAIAERWGYCTSVVSVSDSPAFVWNVTAPAVSPTSVI